MMDSDSRPDGWTSLEPAEIFNDAYLAISDAIQWQLPEERWEAIGQILTVMDATIKAGDIAGLAEATAELEVAGPLRLTRIGGTPIVPPNPEVRRLLGDLEYVLDPPSTRSVQSKDGDSSK